MTYTMNKETDQLVIRRADGARVFTLAPKDKVYARLLLDALNTQVDALLKNQAKEAGSS